MSDVNQDTTTPEPGGDRLAVDHGEHTPPAATGAAAEAKAFSEPRRKAAKAAAAVSDAVGSAADTAPEAASEAESRLRSSFEQARARTQQLSRQARDWADLRQGQAREVVGERPLLAVGAALLVGVLIGSLAAR